MTVTAHTNAVDERFTLGAGNTTWKSLLAAAYPGMHLAHKLFSFTVISGDPVSLAKKTMAAAADGTPFGIGEGDTEGPYGAGVTVDGSKINFFSAAGSVIRVQATNN